VSFDTDQVAACWYHGVEKTLGPLRVARVRSSWERGDGTRGTHESALLRQSWREGKTVKHKTVASLTDLPAAQINALEAGLTPDEVYAAMDWLAGRQDPIEAGLAAKHLTDPAINPDRMALFDLTSTWVEGRCCELAEFGHSRDKKRGLR